MTASNKRVIINGASSGIGAATALAFARTGAQLMLAAHGEAGSKMSPAMPDSWRRGRDDIAGLTDPPESAALAALADEAFGSIDLQFCNIGVVGYFDEVSAEAHARVVETNLIGHMNDAHAVVPLFLRQDVATRCALRSFSKDAIASHLPAARTFYGTKR